MEADVSILSNSPPAELSPDPHNPQNPQSMLRAPRRRPAFPPSRFPASRPLRSAPAHNVYNGNNVDNSRPLSSLTADLIFDF